MTGSFAELVREALREHFCAPPFQLLSYRRDGGPTFTFGELEVELSVVGSRIGGASTLGHLALFDALSRDLGPTLPQGDGAGSELPVWAGPLADVAGGSGHLAIEPFWGVPTAEWTAVDTTPFVARIVAEADRQVRGARPPSWDDLPGLVTGGGPVSGANPKGIALYLAVRGAATAAVDLLERAALQEELRAVAAVASPFAVGDLVGTQERARLMVRRAAELRRFAAHVPTVPDRR